MIIFIFSPLIVILLFFLAFITFTDVQEQIQFHDELLEKGKTIEARLYKKEDKKDKYGLVFQKIERGSSEGEIVFVVPGVLPDDFFRKLTAGNTYKITYFGSFGMFPQFLDKYRRYIPDWKARAIVLAVCIVILSINPRIFYLGFGDWKKK